MTHQKEAQLSSLNHMYRSIGLNKGQNERRLQLEREKSLETASLANLLAKGLTRHSTRIQ